MQYRSADFPVKIVIKSEATSSSSFDGSSDDVALNEAPQVPHIPIPSTVVKHEPNLVSYIEVGDFEMTPSKLEPQFNTSCTSSDKEQECQSEVEMQGQSSLGNALKVVNRSSSQTTISSAKLLPMFRKYKCMVNKVPFHDIGIHRTMCSLPLGPKFIICPECGKVFLQPLHSLPKLGEHIMRVHLERKDKLLNFVQKKYKGLVAHIFRKVEKCL